MTAVKDLERKANNIVDEARKQLLDDAALTIVKAPPGAGKTYLLVQLLEAGLKAGLRLAVATFTNAQADDVCKRFAQSVPKQRVTRWLSGSGAVASGFPANVDIERKGAGLPGGPCVVTATTSKWMLADAPPFDVLLIDEAWQISWADFASMRSVAPRFVLIGDPGQIPPVVSVDTQRWETSPNAPHRPTPELLLNTRAESASLLELPASRRLPADAVDAVNAFYDFDFGAFAIEGDRFVDIAGSAPKHVRPGLEQLRERSIVAMTLPTPDDGPPAEVDDAIAELISDIVAGLLDGSTTVSDDTSTRKAPLPLTVHDVGIVSTHRSMNTRIAFRLPRKFQRELRVDTPERWQGLERKVMIAVHPLSGVVRPEAFSLETGRLCVMASRHRSGLVLVTRDHVGETLANHMNVAEQPVGRPDAEGRGHDRHQQFWNGLVNSGAVVAV